MAGLPQKMNTQAGSVADVSMAEREREIQAIVIGASAGGISALMNLLAPLPETLRIPIVIVLHVAEDKPCRLAEVFSFHIAPQVRFAEDKAFVDVGTVYFASPGYHLSLEKGVSVEKDVSNEKDRSIEKGAAIKKSTWFSLSREEARYFSRPAIDFLFTSAADVYGAALLAVVMTGANEDGAEGLAAVSRAGGVAIVQDPTEAEFNTMPLAALNLCRTARILSLEQIRTLIYRLETLDAG
ncbi:MAG: chemotaxis protein CheB [Cellvibrionaceae bacterium]|nr:chemotaxis protein CheB [Cellvibrionaceae bacterium]